MKRLVMFLVAGILVIPAVGRTQTIGAVTHTSTSQFDLLKIDLAGDVCLLNVFPGDSYSNANQGEYISSMCQRYSALAGINTDYFGNDGSPPYSSGPEGMAYRVGTKYKCDRFRTSMAISADNRVSIDKGYQSDPICQGTRTDSPGALSYLYNVLSGGPLIINNGTILNSSNSCDNFSAGTCGSYWNTATRHTAAGISADGRWLYLLATQPGINVDLNTVATYLKNQGAYRALKYDGGGSSQMYFNGGSLSTGREVVEGLLIIDGTSGRHGILVGQSMTSTPLLLPGQVIQLSVTYQNDGVMPWERTTVVSNPSVNPAYVELRSVDGSGNELPNPPGMHSSWVSTSRITPAGAEFVGREGGPNQATFTFTVEAPMAGGTYTLQVAPFCRTGRIAGAGTATFNINVAFTGPCGTRQIIGCTNPPHPIIPPATSQPVPNEKK